MSARNASRTFHAQTARAGLVAAALLLLVLPAAAEFSPLSTHPEGPGMPVAQMGARERAMGEGGMAAVNPRGFYLPNISRAAWHDRTVFLATLEGDVDWLRDRNSSTRQGTGGFPTLATLFHTKMAGTFGVHYQQTYVRNFEVRTLAAPGEPQASYVTEGGMYGFGASWAYAPVSWLALGVTHNIVLGRDRTIRATDFGDAAPPEAEPMSDTTLETSSSGRATTLSTTVRLPANLDLAFSYTHSASLDVDRRRSVNRQGSDPVADTTASLPRVFAVGAGWKPDRRQAVVADFIYEDWTGGELLNPAWQLSAGYEFRASESPFDGLLKRTAWRAGAGYKVLYLREVPELFATAGFGMPLGPRGHQLDVAVKYGHRQLDGNTFFQEDYLKVSASVTGVSVWGQPVRKRR